MVKKHQKQRCDRKYKNKPDTKKRAKERRQKRKEVTNMTEKFNYCAIIETTLTDQKGKKKTYFPTKMEGLNDNCPFLTLIGKYDDGTEWTKKISKTVIMSIDIKEQESPETSEE